MSNTKTTAPETTSDLDSKQIKDTGNKRKELLDEAARVLNQKGVSQTSLRLIANNVGVSRAALYYYVDDQQDLVYQCYVSTCAQLTGILETSIKSNNNALGIIDHFIASVFDGKRPEFASLSDIAFLREEQHNVVMGFYKGVRASLADVVDDGVRRGQLRPCDSRIVASIILGVIAWVPICMRWIPQEKENYIIFRESIRDILKYGIANERAEIKTFNPFDLSSFLISTGSVFDADARLRARRETLILVASWLFNQKGIEATSLDEIAAEVGVTKKVIYHNIGGKDVLVTECYRRAFHFFKFVADCAKSCSENRLDSTCRSLATLSAASLRKDIAPLVPITSHESWSEEDGEDLYALVGSLIEQGTNHLQGGVDEGSVRALNLQSLLLLRPGFYEWMPRWGSSLSAEELAQAPNELTNVFRLGLAPLDV